MTASPLYPLNDLAFLVTVRVVNDAGRFVPFEEADSPTAFLATSDAPDATAADASLVSEPTYTGTGGRWLVQFDASVLTPTLLDTLFGSATPYCIVQFTENVRVAVELAYSASRLVTVA